MRKKTNLKMIVSDEEEKDFCYNSKEEAWARGQSSAATVWRCERKAEKRQNTISRK